MRATTAEKISRTFSELNNSMLHGENISCIHTSQEKQFLVHERVKNNYAYAKSPTPPPQKSNGPPLRIPDV